MVARRDITAFLYPSSNAEWGGTLKGYALSVWNMTSFRGRHNPFARLENHGSGLNTYKGDVWVLITRMSHADIIFHGLHLTGAPVGWSHIQWCTFLPFFNHMFSITPGVHGSSLCRDSIRTQRGRSSGWDSRALCWDSWVTGVSLGPQSTLWLLCTCQSSCDTNSLLGTRREAGEVRGPRSQGGSPPAGVSHPLPWKNFT